MSDLYLRHSPARRVIFTPFRSTGSSALDMADPEAVSAAVEGLRGEAERSGYAVGLARGQEDGIRLLREQANLLRDLVAGASHDVQEALLVLEPDLVELALTVAGRVVERELTDRPELVQDIVRGVLAAAGTISLTRVRVNPADYDALLPLWPTIAQSMTAVDLVADALVQRGGCIVDTASGFIDGQPATRLEELRRQIESRLGAGV